EPSFFTGAGFAKSFERQANPLRPGRNLKGVFGRDGEAHSGIKELEKIFENSAFYRIIAMRQSVVEIEKKSPGRLPGVAFAELCGDRRIRQTRLRLSIAGPSKKVEQGLKNGMDGFLVGPSRA